MREWSVKHTGISLMDYIVSSLTSEIAPPFSSRRTRRFTGQIVSYGSSTEKSIYAIARGRTFTRIYSIGIRDIKGCNFESNELFTRYIFHGSSGQMLVNDEESPKE